MSPILLLTGFAIGIAFGIVGLLSGFCLLSSLRDWWLSNDGRKIRSYAVALAVAIVGTQFIAEAGLVNIGKSIYLQPSFSAPLIFFGGLLFGLGMVLSNGCASRALVLLGKGNIRSLVVLVIIGVTAQMTLKGLIAPARLGILQWTQWTPSAISAPAIFSALGFSESVARVAATLIAMSALFVFAFSDRRFRSSYGHIAAGAAVGCLVVAGWLATGWLAADDFNPVPVTSLTFISPIADALQYSMFSTGLNLNFGIVLFAGVLIGSAATSLLTGRFQLEGYTSVSHTARSIAGAALMGSGGAMAYGCSIGQGLTGLSTLAIPSLIGVAGIVTGAALGIRRIVVVPAFATR